MASISRHEDHSFFESQTLLQHFWKQQSSCFPSSGSDSDMKSTCKVKCRPLFFTTLITRVEAVDKSFYICVRYFRNVYLWHQNTARCSLLCLVGRQFLCWSKKWKTVVLSKTALSVVTALFLLPMSVCCYVGGLNSHFTGVKAQSFFVVVDDVTQNVYFIDQSFH